MVITYKIVDVDSALGFVKVAINLPDGSIDIINIDLVAIATSEEDTETQLHINISTFVDRRYRDLFPTPKPIPLAINMMVNKVYEVQV